MAFPDQAMITLRFSSSPEKQNRRKGIRRVLWKTHKVNLSSKSPWAKIIAFFISKRSLRLNRPGSRVQPCRINRTWLGAKREFPGQR
jgi:hypothetical protein